MKRLPRVRIEPAPEAHEQALRAWLAEWKTDRILALEEPAERREDGPRAAVLVAGGAAAEPVARGQVRILQPLSEATRHRPRYVAVLEVSGDSNVLLAPFSRFGEPATPGELKTGETALPVRVLCLWNGRHVRASVAQASWFVGALNESVLAEAAEAGRCLAEGTAMPAHLASRIGPPLRHPLDPRTEYVEEERAWMDSATGTMLRGRVIRMPTRYTRPRPTDLPMAAEDKGKYVAGPGAEKAGKPPDEEPDARPDRKQPDGD